MIGGENVAFDLDLNCNTKKCEVKRLKLNGAKGAKTVLGNSKVFYTF